MSLPENKLTTVIGQFNVAGTVEAIVPLSSGHINDTYKISMEKGASYVLQRINGNVFTNAEALVNNKVLISTFLLQQEKHTVENTLSFISTKSRDNYYKDESGAIWNLSHYLEDSKTYLRTPNEKVAFEAGKAAGDFLRDTSEFSIEKLTPIFTDFHKMSVRVQNFETALATANLERLKKAAEAIVFFKENKESMYELEKAIQNKELLLRVTHCDTKISNVLFAQDDLGICMIDTDTVMEGIIHYDYGDAIRTTCNTVDEDEKDIEKVKFSMPFFKAYTKGFYEAMEGKLSQTEMQYLAVSIVEMTFIMGIRFLTDYLSNDIYYKTTHETHNLERANNQIQLIKEIRKEMKKIKEFILHLDS